MPQEAKANYRCQICGKYFGRSEHLRRHILVHSESKPYQCQHCSKGFVRRDALTRHILIHEAPPSLLQRGGRACTNCQRAKVRCTGDKECGRCQNRAIHCEYPPSDIPSDETNGTPGNPRNALSTSRMSFQGRSSAGTQTWCRKRDIVSMPGATIASQIVFTESNAPRKGGSDVLRCGPRSPSNASAYAGCRVSTQTHSASQTVPVQPADYRMNSQIDSSCSTAFAHPAISIPWSSSRSLLSGNESAASGEGQLAGSAVLPHSKGVNTSDSSRQLDARSTPTPVSQNSSSPSDADCGNLISLSVYDEIASLYRRLCLWPLAPWKALEHSSLSERSTLGHFIRLYYLHFDQTLPIWHAALFEKVEQHPVLVVTMAAIGSMYLEAGDDSVRTRSLLLEFGRRCLVFSRENAADGSLNSISLPAAQLLQIVGMAYSGDEGLCRRALDSKRELGQILALCQRELKNSNAVSTAPEGCDDLAWLSWCHHEGLVRLASSTWLVDCVMSYHFEAQPIFSLRDIRHPLPCTEKSWNARTVQEWRQEAVRGSQITLSEALQELYLEKRLPKETGDFARIIIIHGLCQRTWEVQRYFENPLSSWNPSLGRHSSTYLLPEAPVFLRSKSEVRSWQNAACDALALMHRQANTKINQANGHEHATVLHLHVAKLVLMTPFIQIMQFARITSRSYSEDDPAADLKPVIQRWAGQEQKSARAATIHAGLVFWHCRKTTISGFYEAHSVAIAALVLWAFAVFSGSSALSEDSNCSLTGLEDVEQTDDATCGIISIDCPTDEVLVKQFIQRGRMRVRMVEVEDLYGQRGPESVLEQGCKLLSSLSWGASSSWLQLLRGLADMCRKRRKSMIV